MHNTGVNIYITCTLDGYTKDRDADSDNYIAAGEKLIKIDLYKTSIITVNILNGLNIIIFTDTAYCLTFFANVVLIKHFQLKKVYLDEEHS